jgi:hypothetical protein
MRILEFKVVEKRLPRRPPKSPPRNDNRDEIFSKLDRNFKKLVIARFRKKGPWQSLILSLSMRKLLRQLINDLFETFIRLELGLNKPACIKNGSMITAAKAFSDFI